MSKVTITALQQENLLAAQAFWKELPEACVIEGLEDYKQGNKCCLGGWLPQIGYFKELGVIATNSGYPILSTETYPATSVVLFGVKGMFASRMNQHFWGERGVPFTTTDHQLVADRIQWALDNTEVK